jgi:glutathione S-transferase
MKLYFSPGACSLSPHIVLAEAGLPFTTEKVNLKDKSMASGDFKKINPKGQVPTLQLDSGEILTEGVAIVQYIADQKPQAGLMPKAGVERYKALEWLNYISTELHKGYSPLFGAERMIANPEGVSQLKHSTKEGLGRKFDFVSETLSKNDFLLGRNFSVADAYLFTVLSWSPLVGVELEKWPALTAFVTRMKARPSVQAAMKAEGLIK